MSADPEILKRIHDDCTRNLEKAMETSLKAELALRGLDKAQVEKNISFVLDTYNGKTFATLKITGDYHIGPPVTEVEKPFLELEKAIKGQSGANNTIMNSITSMTHHQFTLQGPVADVVKTVNAGLSSPDLHIEIPAPSRSR